jgi:hypothetical protein
LTFSAKQRPVTPAARKNVRSRRMKTTNKRAPGTVRARGTARAVVPEVSTGT